jgi:hypothetical protein
MAIDLKLIDKLLADYKKPEDIIGEEGLLKRQSINQTCPLSEYLPSVRRIERNIENLPAIPGEKRLSP